MADFRDSTTLPRRAVIAGSAATLVAVPLAGAKASTGDPVFAGKKRAAVAAWAELQAIYDEQHRRIDALHRPVLPKELLQPLRLPGSATPAAADEEGWSTKTLSGIVGTGMYLTTEITRTAFGQTMRVEHKPVSAATRRRAAELLKVRQAYEAERDAWWEKVHAIEDTSTEPLRRAIDLAFALMAYPVFTVDEVRDKLALVEDFDLFNLTDDEESLRGWLIRDALAAAEKAVLL